MLITKIWFLWINRSIYNTDELMLISVKIPLPMIACSLDPLPTYVKKWNTVNCNIKVSRKNFSSKFWVQPILTVVTLQNIIKLSPPPKKKSFRLENHSSSQDLFGLTELISGKWLLKIICISPSTLPWGLENKKNKNTKTVDYFIKTKVVYLLPVEPPNWNVDVGMTSLKWKSGKKKNKIIIIFQNVQDLWEKKPNEKHN